MRFSILSNIVLLVVGALWAGVIGYFIFSTDLWSTYLVIVAGIFTTLAFLFSAWVQRHTNQAYGLTVLFGLIGMALTALAFNHAFFESELVYSICTSVIFTLLFFLAVVKIWDSVEYLQGE